MSRVIYTPREPKYRKQRRIILTKKTALMACTVLLAVCLVAGIIYALRQPYFRIKRIEFSGLMVLKQEELEKHVKEKLAGYYSVIFPRDSYFFTDIEDISTYLKEKFPRVVEIKISKKLPDKLRIEIVERKFFSLLCGSDFINASSTPNCFFIDQTGFVYEKAPIATGSLILKIFTNNKNIATKGKMIDAETMKQVRSATENFSFLLGSSLVAFQINSDTPKELKAVTSGGYRLYLNREDDFKQTFTSLKVLLEKEIGDKIPRLDYVDLRFGNKIFYKFRN